MAPIDDIKLNKPTKSKFRYWARIKTYSLVFLILWLLVRSDLYSVAEVETDKKFQLTEVCFYLNSKECNYSILFKNLK